MKCRLPLTTEMVQEESAKTFKFKAENKFKDVLDSVIRLKREERRMRKFNLILSPFDHLLQ